MMAVDIHPDADTLAAAIAEHITSRLALLQASDRVPTVALTGGTVAAAAYRLITSGAVDWTKVELFWSDERFVPAGHADRNDQQARDTFLTRLHVPEENIHPMPALGCGLSLAEAADQYAALLPAEPFDLVLFGMGPDGHVASLFPGFPQLHEDHRRVVEVVGSPKLPSERISLTFPALNHAEAVWFLVSGAEKAEAVARALGEGSVEETPARGAHGISETTWLIDEAAASQL